MKSLSRREFLKLGGLSLGSMAFSPKLGEFYDFDDNDLVRVATAQVSVYRRPNDKSAIISTWYRDELLRVYEEVVADEPVSNPIWYRVWGGFVHRARLQKVKTLYNPILPAIPEGEQRLAEVTVPFSNPYRRLKTATTGWEKLNPPIYYGSIHLIRAIEEGPDGEPWYRIYDELDSNVPYYVPAIHMRVLSAQEISPLSPNVAPEKKRIEVNLSTQVLTAYEDNKSVLQTKISSGVLLDDFKTPTGEFRIAEKMPAKHMGYSYFGMGSSGVVNSFADADGYALPGVPWSCFFTKEGHAFHGTYWHDNFGTPMSHGCINMRTEEAKWLFRWAMPEHLPDRTNNRGYGTLVEIDY